MHTRMLAAVAGLFIVVALAFAAGRGSGGKLASSASPTPRGDVLGVVITPAPEASEPDDEPRPIDDAPIPTPAPTTAPSPAPTATPRTIGTTTTPAPTPPPGPRPARPASINCRDDAQAQWCSASSEGMTLSGGKMESRTSGTRQRPSDVPEFTIVSILRGPDGGQVGPSREVNTVRVDARIRNNTGRWFVFPDGELGLRVLRDGQVYTQPTTREGYLELGPGAEFLATFEFGVFRDGYYEWDAWTWFYPR